MHYFGLFLKKTLRFLLKPLSFLPALAMMYMIFRFSSQTGSQSGALSLKVSRGLVKACDKVMDLELDGSQLALYANELHFYVRKAAHFSEYFLLAVSVAFPLYVYRIRGLWLVLLAGLFCIGFAGLDEYHQSFVAGRGPSLRDVGIDSLGAFAGIYLTRMVCFLGRKTIFRPLSLHRDRDA